MWFALSGDASLVVGVVTVRVVTSSVPNVKTATEVEVRAIQDHKVMEWNTCWKCRLLEGTDDI